MENGHAAPKQTSIMISKILITIGDKRGCEK
jgi:hypothetical protein